MFINDAISKESTSHVRGERRTYTTPKTHITITNVNRSNIKRVSILCNLIFFFVCVHWWLCTWDMGFPSGLRRAAACRFFQRAYASRTQVPAPAICIDTAVLICPREPRESHSQLILNLGYLVWNVVSGDADGAHDGAK